MSAKNTSNKLTDPAIRNAKPREAVYNLPDGGGLGLEVQPSGAKWWRLRYRFGGKEKMLSLGTHPEVWHCYVSRRASLANGTGRGRSLERVGADVGGAAYATCWSPIAIEHHSWA